MTRKTFKTLTASLLALAIGSATFTTPAAAGGSLSLSFTPTNARHHQALTAGLQVYSTYKGLKHGANVRQKGTGNAAGIGQNGYGNFGLVHQDGSGHTGTLQQNGNRNAYGLFQFGRNTQGHVVQNGNRRSGAAFQFGW